MNKTEVIAEVSRMTNISVSDCEKVLDAFEEVLGGELNRKGWKNGISEMIFKIMGKIKGKKGVIGIYIRVIRWLMHPCISWEKRRSVE